MNKSNNFGLKNNESGPIHDYQITLNELQIRLTRTENRERNFINITPNLKNNVESHKIILARRWICIFSLLTSFYMVNT
jgi:hypothetical protein